MKAGMAPGHSEVSFELIAAIGGVGIQVMAEIYLRMSLVHLDCQLNGL